MNNMLVLMGASVLNPVIPVHLMLTCDWLAKNFLSRGQKWLNFKFWKFIFRCLFTSNIKSNVLNANFLLKNNQKTGSKSSKITKLGNFGSFECVDITKNHEIFQKLHETDSKLIKIVFNQWKIVMFDWKIINRSWFLSKIMLNQK